MLDKTLFGAELALNYWFTTLRSTCWTKPYFREIRENSFIFFRKLYLKILVDLIC